MVGYKGDSMTEIPVKIVGGNSFGIYKKISAEKTINLFESDGALISFAGYKRTLDFHTQSQGRGLFHSVRGKFIINVVGSDVYRINEDMTYSVVGRLTSSYGEVYIDENLASQICIVDGSDAYIYNWRTGGFLGQNIKAKYDITPTYVSYHNSNFLISPSFSDTSPQNWYVYKFKNDNEIEPVAASDGGAFPIQTKPDFCVAVHRLPGRSNHILVLGSIVCEVWTQVGGAQNYRRNASFNIDSGCVSRESIASSEQFICWLAQNESSQRTIMMTDGSDIKTLSTKGIDRLLSQVEFPEDSTGFFFRQDGHLFYQLTFYGEVDPFSMAYDFELQQFYYVTDHLLGNHPARKMVYFNNKLFFNAINNGALYESSIDIAQAIDVIGDTVGKIIPRIVITNTIRQPSNKPFRALRFGFTLEQGHDHYYPAQLKIFGQMVDENDVPIISEGGALVLSEDGYLTNVEDIPHIDMAMSKNGGETFSNYVRKDLQAEGHYKNMLHWDRLGHANELTIMLRFYGLQRFVVFDGVLEVSE